MRGVQENFDSKTLEVIGARRLQGFREQRGGRKDSR